MSYIEQTESIYSDKDVLICRMYQYDIGRTKNGKWVNMNNEPINDVVLWSFFPVISGDFIECFKRFILNEKM